MTLDAGMLFGLLRQYIVGKISVAELYIEMDAVNQNGYYLEEEYVTVFDNSMLALLCWKQEQIDEDGLRVLILNEISKENCNGT